MENLVTIFDTSYGSLNVGDFIIMESINDVLNEIISSPKIFLMSIPTHIDVSGNYYEKVKRSKLKIVCGTNLFHMEYLPISKFNSWKISIKEINILNNTLLFGVGAHIPNDVVSIKRKLKKFIA